MIDVIRLPIFCTISMASLFQALDVSIAIGTNRCGCCYGHVFGGLESCRLICCSSCMYGRIFKVRLANVSGTVIIRNCHDPGQRISSWPRYECGTVWFLPSVRDSPTGSLATGICARVMPLHITSLSWACRCCLALLRLHNNPWSLRASTSLPHGQVCGSHVRSTSRYPTATRIAQSQAYWCYWRSQKPITRM